MKQVLLQQVDCKLVPVGYRLVVEAVVGTVLQLVLVAEYKLVVMQQLVAGPVGKDRHCLQFELADKRFEVGCKSAGAVDTLVVEQVVELVVVLVVVELEYYCNPVRS